MSPIDPFHLEPHASDDDGGGPRPCVNCGYDLRGTPINRPCPECGATHAAVVEGSPEGTAEGTPCRTCGTQVPRMPLGSLCPTCAKATSTRARRPRCAKCKYDLTGLVPGSACPECGTTVQNMGGWYGDLPSLTMPQLPGDVMRSVTWQFGLWLMVIGGWGGLLAAALRTLHGVSDWFWNSLVVLVMVMAAVAAWCVTPGAVDGETKWMAPLRWATRLCIIGLPTAALADTTAIEVGLGFIGLLGLTGMLWVLAMLSRVGEEMHVSRRFELAWMLCVPLGAIAWLLPIPGGEVMLDRTGVGWVVFFLLIVMMLPTAVLVWFIARPAWTLLHLSRWASQNAIEARARDVKWKRPTACRQCGHSLEGVLPNAPCPQCGMLS